MLTAIVIRGILAVSRGFRRRFEQVLVVRLDVIDIARIMELTSEVLDERPKVGERVDGFELLEPGFAAVPA